MTPNENLIPVGRRCIKCHITKPMEMFDSYRTWAEHRYYRKCKECTDNPNNERQKMVTIEELEVVIMESHAFDPEITIRISKDVHLTRGELIEICLMAKIGLEREQSKQAESKTVYGTLASKPPVT